MKEYTQRLEAIENYLLQWDFPLQPTTLYDPIRYFVRIGGKRIRPLFTVLSGELFGVSMAEALPGAAALELFHNFTLIHDDIMDNAPVRRGKQTVHEQWNSNVAILSGDVLMIHAFQALAHYDAATFKKLSTLLNKTAIEVCMGQQMDMDFETNAHVTEAEYIEMIRLKTSVLLGCSCAFGGLIAGLNGAEVDHLYAFGENLGIAFQIQDDILDAFGETEKVGKQAGGDILNDKKTILYTTFQAMASTEEKKQFSAFSHAKKEEKILGIQALYQQSGVLAHCRKKQADYTMKAMRHLEEIQCPYEKSQLLSLAEFITKRAY